MGAVLAGVIALVALSGNPAAAAAAGPVNAANAPVVVSAQQSALGVGRVLVNARGASLYVFSGDALSSITGCLPTNMSTMGTPCTSVWRPVMATGPLVAADGVLPRGLGHMSRPGIGSQVTYFGQPLYTFVFDLAAGQENG
jgi:predicted lipoprotein with Yx(FWY)xxD motif